jgi:hypothetical protein
VTTFTRTWNTAYEATPPDSQNASQGAQRMRENKLDVRERLEVDHSMAGDTEDGEHLKVTMKSRTAPTNMADHVILYAKDVSAKSEAFVIDEDGDEVQLTSGGVPYLLTQNNAWQKGQATAESTITYGTTITPDASLSNAFKCTLTGNVTVAKPTNGKSGQVISIRFINTNSRTLAFSNIYGSASDDLTFSTGATDQDLLVMYCDGTDWYVLNLKKDIRNAL